MKKNYVYIIAPIAALAIFIGFYVKYSASYDERMAEMHRKELEAAQKKLDEDAKNREVAAKAAFAAQEKRKAEKKAKDEKDAADKEMRDNAQQAMRKAQRDAQKLAERVKQLTKDVKSEQEEIEKIETERKSLITEIAFQAQAKKTVEGQAQTLAAKLDEMDAAEKKWVEAQKAAAAAAAAKKN